MLLQKTLQLRHLLSIGSLDRDTITQLLDRAEYFLKKVVRTSHVLEAARGKVVANLFFEASTRTRNSFEIAANRLGAIVLSPDMKQSATLKGELLIDTIHNLEAMGANALVIRHPDNNLAQFLAAELQTEVAVINAGDGSNEHPTQTLVDLMTIRQHFPDLSNLTITIVGDLKHSRVARSLVVGLKMMGVGRIRLVAPDYFLPEEASVFEGLDTFNSMDAGLQGADIIYMLRIQKERMDENEHPNELDYFSEFGLSKEKLTMAKPGALVMHPGPMNRGVEIESFVADGSQSVILQQTQNSVPLRMAVLEAVLASRL